MGNVRSPPNKMDELASLSQHQREYQQCSIRAWLTLLTPDTDIAPPRFQVMQADKVRESGKRKGGGPCL